MVVAYLNTHTYTHKMYDVTGDLWVAQKNQGPLKRLLCLSRSSAFPVLKQDLADRMQSPEGSCQVSSPCDLDSAYLERRKTATGSVLTQGRCD